MKTQPSITTTFGSILVLAVALFAGGCGNSAQKKAYEHAVRMEQSYTAETATAIIAEYRKVIALEPDSGLAKKSHERIAAIEARVKAEETHKDVFQEHGID